MKKSELIAMLNAFEGDDLNIYLGDMKPLKADDIDLVVSENPTGMCGTKYIHIGNW